MNRAQAIGKQIDLMFANSPAETKTSSERAMAQSFVNQIGNIGAILSAIVARGVLHDAAGDGQHDGAIGARTHQRARRAEDARASATAGVLGLVLAESVLVTTLGGLLGMFFAWWIGVQFEPTLDQYLPGFRVPPEAFVEVGAVHAGARRGRGRRAGLAGDAPAHRRSVAAGLSAA